MDSIVPDLTSCPLSLLSVDAIDAMSRIGKASDAAYTEGAQLAYMAECGGACGVRGLCLALNPDASEEAKLLRQYLELFEAAVTIGQNREYSTSLERDAILHPRYAVRF